MKKKKLNNKLKLTKNVVSNLSEIKGGVVQTDTITLPPTFTQTETAIFTHCICNFPPTTFIQSVCYNVCL